jgi:phosphate transport system substrate-binding protein
MRREEMQRRSQKRHIRRAGIAGVYNSKTIRASEAVHKNDTTVKPALDSLAHRGDDHRAYRIDSRIELFPPPAFSTLKQNPKPDIKGAHILRAHRSLILTLILTLSLAVPATASAKRLIIGGSTSILPLAQKLATAYHKAYPKIPAPKVGGGQSDIGIKGAASGEFDIGDSSRNPIKEVDPKGLQFTKIAQDGICIITSPQNPLANLQQQTVEQIFTGTIRDWSQVPGAHVTGAIDLFDRDGASGTQDAFQHIFLGENLKISPSATEEESNGLEQVHVEKDEHAIGFVSFAYTSGVNAVGYNHIPCTLHNAKTGQYGGVRNFWMVTKGKPKGEALKFLAWVTKPHNKTVEAIVNSSWIAVY